MARMEAMLLAHQANTEARIADMDSRLAGVEARAPVPATQGVLQPSPTRIAPQPVFAQEVQQATPVQVLLQPTQPMQATALPSPLRSPSSPLARGGRATAYFASPASDQGPSFTTLGSFENLLLFGQGLFPGYVGRDFGSHWPVAGRAVRSKLLQVYTYLQPLDRSALEAFCAAYPGKRGVANFTAAYKFVTSSRAL